MVLSTTFQNTSYYFQNEQESPPAWTQEAYRPPCSEYSFCCPTRVPPRGGTWPRYPPGGSGYPPGRGGYLTRVPPGGDLTRVPPRGVPDPGTPPGGGGGGVPDPGPPGGGYLTRVPPRGGVPDLGTPPGGGGPGTPQGGYLTQVPPRGECTWPGYPPASWHSGKCCKALWDMGTPPLWTDRLMDGQTRVKTLPSLVLRTRAVTRNARPYYFKGGHVRTSGVFYFNGASFRLQSKWNFSC